VDAPALLLSVTEIFSGDTVIIFNSSLEELIAPLVTVNLALNPEKLGERYLTMGLRPVDPVGVPPGKFHVLLVGLPTEASWNKT
jgi:hypothetical protein